MMRKNNKLKKGKYAGFYKKVKNNNNGKRKTNVGSRSRLNKPLKKNEYNAVKKMIDRALDVRIEDKFLLDSSFNDIHNTSWDSTSQSYLMNYTPTIMEGTGPSARVGKKIHLKQFRLQLRFLPSGYQQSGTTEQSNGFYNQGVNPYIVQPPLECFFCSIPRDLWENTSSSDLRQVLAVKFRADGTYRQDFINDVGQHGVKGIKLISKISLKPKYRTQAVYRDEYTDLLGNTYPQSLVIENFPQYCNGVIKAKIDRTALLESNQPAKLIYFLYARQASKWLDTTFDHGIHQATNLSSRTLWTYEDS